MSRENYVYQLETVVKQLLDEFDFSSTPATFEGDDGGFGVVSTEIHELLERVERLVYNTEEEDDEEEC